MQDCPLQQLPLDSVSSYYDHGYLCHTLGCHQQWHMLYDIVHRLQELVLAILQTKRKSFIHVTSKWSSKGCQLS